MDDGCSNDGLVDGLRTQLLAFEDLRVLSHVEKLLAEHKSVLNDLTNDILSAITNIDEDLIGKGRFTVYVWETKHKPVHDFLHKQIKYALGVVGRRDLSNTEAERMATVWRVVDRYPYVTWGVDSIVDSFEETLQMHLQQLLGSGDLQGCMDALKVIKPLPTERMEPKLSCVLNRIATLTKKADTQTFDAARSTLLSCLDEEQFGMKYLQVVIQSLHDVWEQPTQGHDEIVNFVLSTCIDKCARCLKDLSACVESAEQKNKGRNKYTFDSLKFVAENVILESQALGLISLVTAAQRNEETRSVVEESLEYISEGFANNISYAQEDLFELIYDLLGIGDEKAGFALGLLHKRLKKKNKMEELLNQEELLDPFVGVVIGFLSNTQLVSSALSVLDLLMSFQLPSLSPEGDKYEGENKVLALAMKSDNEEIRSICKKILLDFLLKDSRSDDERLLKHTSYLLDELRSNNQNETADRAMGILYAFFTATDRRKFLNTHSRPLFLGLLSLMPPSVVSDQSSSIGDLIGWLINNIDREYAGSLLLICLDSFEEYPAAVVKVMVFFMETLRTSIKKNFKPIWKKMQIADTAFKKYCSLVMVHQVLFAFPHYSSVDDYEDMWTLVFRLLLQRDARLRNIRLILLKRFSDAFESASENIISDGLKELKGRVERMTQGNSGKKRLRKNEEIGVQRKK